VTQARFPRRQLRGLLSQHKYRARRTVVDGEGLASQAEARRYRELQLLAARNICRFYRQRTFALGCPENKYRVDFVVEMVPETDPGAMVWPSHAEDVKGYETKDFKRWRRLWEKYGPMPLVVLKVKGKGWSREIILPEAEMKLRKMK